MKRSRAIRRRVPFFPVVPLVPLGLLFANVSALVTLFRRLKRLERRADIGAVPEPLIG
jgi:hypothetical protein